MRFIIRQDAQEACSFIAEYIIDRITRHNRTHDRPFVLGLPTGSSPLPIYAALISAHRQGRISFANVITFNMDEYVGLPDRDHPVSYRTFMYRNLFDHIDIPESNINLLDGFISDSDMEEEEEPDENDEENDNDDIETKLATRCSHYEAKIREVGGIDLFLGGVGSDGHIAFNEPGSSLSSRTRVKALTRETRVANARFFDDHDPSSSSLGEVVPHLALTVGVQTIMDSREVVIVATGSAKSLAVRDAVEGGVSHMCTLSCLQMHRRGMIVADEEAVGELKYKTVQYFKEVEETMRINKKRASARRGSVAVSRKKRQRKDESVSGDACIKEGPPSVDVRMVEEPKEIEPEEQRGTRGKADQGPIRSRYQEADEEEDEPELFPDNMASRIKGFAGLPVRSATFPSVFLQAS